MELLITGIDVEKKKIVRNIAEWGRGHYRYLNVVSLPYNTTSLFLEIIEEYIHLDKKIIFICNSRHGESDLINNIKKHTDIKCYTYYRGNCVLMNTSLVVTNHQIAENIEDKFDLVIYDDITSIPYYDKEQIVKLMEKLAHAYGKLISYSIESIFQKEKEIILPMRDDGKPLSEPRLIKTRIDLNGDIPYVVYEYIKWSLKQDRNIIIYAPDSERAGNVYNYFYNFHRNICNEVSSYIGESGDKKPLYNFLVKKREILVTEVYDVLCTDLKNIDVMVYFSDDPLFTYKKLVFICCKVSGVDMKEKGEVILLASSFTEQIEKAKSIIRGFNKEAWETGLLNI